MMDRIFWAMALCILAVLLYMLRGQDASPPGPSTIPVIGNLHQYPKNTPRNILAHWHRKYGPIIRVQLGSQTMISLGSLAVAMDLLGKRGRVYSSRPPFPMAAVCLTRGLHTGLIPYGPRWQAHNRIDLSLLGPRKTQHYQEVIDRECTRTLHDLAHGKDFPEAFIRFSSSLIWTLAYGKDLTGDEADFREMRAVVDQFTKATSAGAWLVDMFPVLNNLPKCLAPWKRTGDEFHTRASRLFNKNFTAALETGSWNFARHISDVEDTTELSREEVAYMLGVLLEGGIDTTSTVLCNVVLACICHPNATRKAQEELDRVVGMTRLPCADDLPHLHFVRAFINEVLRWRSLVPEGVLRYTSDEDHYRGYRIKKGTIVMFNHWSAHFDEDVYSNATAFEPERWIQNPDLPLQPFGVGRRACPGQHLSRASLSAIISQMLWAFNIEPGRVDGVPVDLDPSNMTQTGTLLQPSPFKAIITARDEHHAAVLHHKFHSQDSDISAILDRVGLAVGYLSQKEGMLK